MPEEKCRKAADLLAKCARISLLDNHKGNVTDRELMVQIAAAVAAIAHMKQKDAQGVPYFHHPEYVASLLDTPEEKCVGYLHDTLEDTALTADDLRPVFGDTITDAVVALTHQKNMPYLDYIRNLKKNPLARKVKFADLRHNMNSVRQKHFDTAWTKRMEEKYIPAIKILIGEMN